MIRYILIFLLLAFPVNAAVIFEDNFDSHADWQPAQGTSSYNCDDDCTTQPTGYHSYYIKGTVYPTPQEDTIRITGEQYRGASGKAFIHFSESDVGTNWPADGILGLSLSSGYTELYYRYFIKFQSGFEWDTSQSVGQKFSRVSHYVGGAPFSYHDPRNQRPLSTMLLNKSSSSSNHRTTLNFRYEVEKYPSDASPSHDDTEDGPGFDFDGAGKLGDGNWHCVEHYVKLNTSIGATDGIAKLWIDGVLEVNVTDLEWGDTGGTASPRYTWNYVALGGNVNNPWAAVGAKEEQWYAIDDFVVSTTYIGTEYVIGGAIPDTTPPTIDSVNSDKPNGTYGEAEVIDIDVYFSESVTSTGDVIVTLDTGRTCTFSISSSSSGTCNYTVQAGDTSADLTVTSISGTIEDESSNAMVDDTIGTNLAANKAIVIDTTPAGDSTAPTPNPMTFSTPPEEATTSSITMTATTATDPSTPIEYLFTTTTEGCRATTNLGSPEQPANKDGETYHGSSYIYKAASTVSGYITKIEIYVDDFHAGVLDFGVFSNTGGLNFTDMNAATGITIADGLNVLSHDDTDFDAADLRIETGQYIGFFLTSDGEADRQIGGDPGPGYWYSGSDQISDTPASGVFIDGQQYELQVRVFIEDEIPLESPGGTSSSWQVSATYEDTGLTVGRCYSYTVSARDSEANTTAASAAASATIVNVPSITGLAIGKLQE